MRSHDKHTVALGVCILAGAAALAATLMHQAVLPMVAGGVIALCLARIGPTRLAFAAPEPPCVPAREPDRTAEPMRPASDAIATMSHEVRQPLGCMIGLADVMLQSSDLADEHRRHLGLIRTTGLHLQAVLDDVLDLSRIEAGQVAFVTDPYRLDALVEDCVALLRPGAQARGIALDARIDPDLPASVVGCEGRMRQVVFNLLGNALKFTQAGRVELTLARSGSVPDARLRVEVRDTGIGIAPEAMDRLFSRFTQADGAIQRDYGGHGLGLAISQHLVRLMGGEITVASEVGRGSTFTFSLPLVPAEDGPAEAPVAAAGVAAPPLAILVADDEPTNREVFAAMLASAGHRVVTVPDGTAALAALDRAAYDLVVMDVRMPGMGGLAATRAIRTRPGPKGRIPILALTGGVTPREIDDMRAAGMSGHLGKPVTRERLLACVGGLAAQVPQAAPAASPDPFRRDTYEEMLHLLGPEKIRRYLDEMARRLAVYDDPAVLTDMAALGAAAHKMVGLAGMLGFTRLAESCRDLDLTCARDGDIAEPLGDVLAAAAAMLRIVARLDADRPRATAGLAAAGPGIRQPREGR